MTVSCRRSNRLFNPGGRGTRTRPPPVHLPLEAGFVHVVSKPIEERLESCEESDDIVVSPVEDPAPPDAQIEAILRFSREAAHPHRSPPPGERAPGHLSRLIDHGGHVTSAIVDARTEFSLFFAQWTIPALLLAPTDQSGRSHPFPEQVLFHLIVKLRERRLALIWSQESRIL